MEGIFTPAGISQVKVQRRDEGTRRASVLFCSVLTTDGIREEEWRNLQ